MSKAKSAAGDFRPSKAAERTYERQLRGVATQIRVALAGKAPERAEPLLREYAKVVEPWARQSAANMLLQVRRKNDQAWQSMAGRMGQDMRAFLATDLGQVVQERINANVKLIRSLVIDSADRVGELVRESMATGARAEDLAKRIEHIGEVSASRARVIAATEVSKASTALTQARAQSVGSEGYIWRTARDGDTRDSHRAMEGRFVRWSEPPRLDNMTGHAGEFPNCRCYPEPVIKNEAGEAMRQPLPTMAEELERGEIVLRSQWERQETSTVVPHLEGEPLPGVDKLIPNLPKLRAYSLNPDHPRGGNKAKVFRAALGMGPEHAELLQQQILALVPHLPAERHASATNMHGELFNVDIPVTGPNGRTVAVRTAWVYERKNGRQSARPRLANAFVSRRSRG